MAHGDLLATYLQDHFAGSSAAVDRCRYVIDRNRGTALGAFVETLLREIEEDRATLLRIMQRVEARPSRLKALAAEGLERVGRLKPNGRLTGYSPLSRLLDLELLSTGVEGKRLLWAALAARDDERFREFDLAALEQRATRQREAIEGHRLAAARSLADVG